MRPDQEGYLVRLTMSPGVPTLGLLRNRIGACLDGLGGEDIADIQLVATELVTNAYEHGEPPVLFAMLTRTGDGLLRIEVSDRGARLPRLRRPDSHTTHGRGLQLVAAFTERWGVWRERIGKTVWAEFATKLPPIDAAG